jgi:hypothetical protein
MLGMDHISSRATECGNRLDLRWYVLLHESFWRSRYIPAATLHYRSRCWAYNPGIVVPLVVLHVFV